MKCSDSYLHSPELWCRCSFSLMLVFKWYNSVATEMIRGICQMMILNRTSMSLRDLSHQTPTWTRSVGSDFLWWRRMLYCTVTSMTRTKRCHRSAGGALPLMVRPLPHLKTRCYNCEDSELLQMWRLCIFKMSAAVWCVCVCVCVWAAVWYWCSLCFPCTRQA